MGEFITRGMAIGFFAGVSTALLARRHSSLRKHPTLLGFAVAGTVDAASRDYRRPMVYDKLMKLDSPLAIKSRSILLSIRTGVDEEGPTMVNVPSSALQKKVIPEQRLIETGSPSTDLNAPKSDANDWWGAEGPEENSPKSEKSQLNNPYGYPIKLPPGGPLQGTRTWEEIRRGSSQSDK